MPLSPGDKLGPYEILALVGKGGMGEVYRAHDSGLNRDVAIKVSNAQFSERFTREARAIAALNHTNICHLYDVGRDYLVMEYVEGSDLRGPLDFEDALLIVQQLIDGIEAAHEKNIIHRDLKPANIKVTPEGVVKILDFGLAKAQEQAPSQEGHPENSPTLTLSETRAGTIIGTAAYMAPEQAKGKAADRRSDIWSFGVILYEVLTGKRLFQGESAVEILGEVLNKEPDISAAPARAHKLLRWCLEKDRKQRLASISDATRLLRSETSNGTGAGSQSGATPGLPGCSPLRKRAVTAAAALVMVAVGVAAGRFLFRTPAAPDWSGGMLGGPEIALDPRLSPDGSLLAFQGFDRGLTQVAVMKPESGNWSILTHSRERGFVTVLAWSADGASIYYDRLADVPHGVYSVPLLGGDEHLVLENAGTPQPLPDGSLLVTRLNAKRQTQLFRFWPDTGRLQEGARHRSGAHAARRASQ
jgi:predicted Ser/Thr protein kinase